MNGVNEALLQLAGGGDRAVAAVDVIGRTGAIECQVGYLDDAGADWYAHARWNGARISVEHQDNAEDALDALAIRLLLGGTCRCGRRVKLVGRETPRACTWSRVGPRWEPGCDAEGADLPSSARGDLSQAAAGLARSARKWRRGRR